MISAEEARVISSKNEVVLNEHLGKIENRIREAAEKSKHEVDYKVDTHLFPDLMEMVGGFGYKTRVLVTVGRQTSIKISW